MVTYIFPGQGSQYKGMGVNLFDEFSELVREADEILGYSLKNLCINDPHKLLKQTQYTQPALFAVNALSYLKKIKNTGKKPDFVAGHSLGEYNALFAGGAYDFATGLRMVKKRGELMSQAEGGGMAAILGLEKEKVDEILKENGFKTVVIANCNTLTQNVVSGPKEDIERLVKLFLSTKATCIPLNVSGAFHSRYMKDAQGEFEKYLESFVLFEPEIPVISNVKAGPYQRGEVKKNLIKQFVCPVQWNNSIEYLLGLGEMEFEEVGPGNVLTKLVQKIRKQPKPVINREEMGETEKTQTTPKQLKEKIAEENQVKQREILSLGFNASFLGNEDFRKDYNLKYPYLAGGMYRGISSKELVVKMGKAGMMGFFGTGGLKIEEIEKTIQYIQKELDQGQPYGMNLLHLPGNPEIEEEMVDLFLRHGVKTIEAAAYMSITPALIKYRAQDLKRNTDGTVSGSTRIIAKVSRPEPAEFFLTPAPKHIVDKLFKEDKITKEQAELLREISVADDLCAEADSGGHTDGRNAYAQLPTIIKIRDEMVKKYNYHKNIRVGAAGGIGTPEAAAAAFIMGADFIVTGSINQCTVEAGTSVSVKNILQNINAQDTEYAPAGDMFEFGSKVQVVKKGLFFPARANKLYELYRQFNSIDEINEKTRTYIQEKYFRRSFEEVYQEVKEYYSTEKIEKAERNPKYKMALIFSWYFSRSTHLAISGSEEFKVDYQIHCSPALGSFNQWVKGTALEQWRNRHVDLIGEKLMSETAKVIESFIRKLALS